jgi:hypothetical protein
MTIGNIMTKPVKDPITYTRDEMRAGLLGNAPKPQTRSVTLFGIPIELHQPTLGGILEAQGIDDPKEQACQTMIRYSYVPGTNTRVFEDSDIPVMLNWPFTDELIDVQTAIAEMTGLNIGVAEEKLNKNPLSKPS